MKAIAEIRKQTYSKKWSRYGTKDILPFWIADMDFKSPEFLAEHLINRVKADYFGYTDISKEINVAGMKNIIIVKLMKRTFFFQPVFYTAIA